MNIQEGNIIIEVHGQYKDEVYPLVDQITATLESLDIVGRLNLLTPADVSFERGGKMVHSKLLTFTFTYLGEREDVSQVYLDLYALLNTSISGAPVVQGYDDSFAELPVVAIQAVNMGNQRITFGK